MYIQVGIHGLFSSYPEPVADGVERKLGLKALDGTLVEPSIRELPLDISAYGKAFLSAIEIAIPHLDGILREDDSDILARMKCNASVIVYRKKG